MRGRSHCRSSRAGNRKGRNSQVVSSDPIKLPMLPRLQDVIYDLYLSNRTHFLRITDVKRALSPFFPSPNRIPLLYFIKTHPEYLQIENNLLVIFQPTKQSMCPFRRKCRNLKCRKIHAPSNQRSFEASIFRLQLIFAVSFRDGTDSPPENCSIVFCRNVRYGAPCARCAQCKSCTSIIRNFEWNSFQVFFALNPCVNGVQSKENQFYASMSKINYTRFSKDSPEKDTSISIPSVLSNLLFYRSSQKKIFFISIR